MPGVGLADIGHVSQRVNDGIGKPTVLSSSARPGYAFERELAGKLPSRHVAGRVLIEDPTHYGRLVLIYGERFAQAPIAERGHARRLARRVEIGIRAPDLLARHAAFHFVSRRQDCVGEAADRRAVEAAVYEDDFDSSLVRLVKKRLELGR